MSRKQGRDSRPNTKQKGRKFIKTLSVRVIENVPLKVLGQAGKHTKFAVKDMQQLGKKPAQVRLKSLDHIGSPLCQLWTRPIKKGVACNL